jgi:hypothetical protein
MTVPAVTPQPAHTDAVAGHAYCMPIVRELPLPVVDPPGDRTW